MRVHLAADGIPDRRIVLPFVETDGGCPGDLADGVGFDELAGLRGIECEDLVGTAGRRGSLAHTLGAVDGDGSRVGKEFVEFPVDVAVKIWRCHDLHGSTLTVVSSPF